MRRWSKRASEISFLEYAWNRWSNCFLFVAIVFSVPWITLTIVVSARWCLAVFRFLRVASLVSKKSSRHEKDAKFAKKLLIFVVRVPIGFVRDFGSQGSAM